MTDLAQSALNTARRLAAVVEEHKRLGRLINKAHTDCVDETAGPTHLTRYLDAYRAGAQEHDFHQTQDTQGSRHAEAEASAEDEWEALKGCPACATAYQAIQERKAITRQRGALRSALVRIGRLATAQEERHDRS